MTEFNLAAAYEAAHKGNRGSLYVDREYWAYVAAGHLKEACDVIVKQNAELRQVRQGDSNTKHDLSECWKLHDAQATRIKELEDALKEEKAWIRQYQEWLIEEVAEGMSENGFADDDLRQRARDSLLLDGKIGPDTALKKQWDEVLDEATIHKKAEKGRGQDRAEGQSIMLRSSPISEAGLARRKWPAACIEAIEEQATRIKELRAELASANVELMAAGETVRAKDARIKELEDALVEAKATIKFCLDEGDEDENYGPMHDLPEWRELPEKDKKVFRDWCRKQLAVKCPVDAIYCSFRDEGEIGPDASKPHIKELEDALEDKPPVKPSVEWFYCPPDKKLQRGDLVQLPAEWDGGTIGFVKGVDEQLLYNMGRIKRYVIVADAGHVLHLSEEAAEALKKPTPEQLEKFAKAVFGQWF